MRRLWHLRAQPHQTQVQNAAAQASASTTASEANANRAAGQASASTTAEEASARSASHYSKMLELAGYLANAAGPVPLVQDLRIAHDRFRSSSDPP